MGNARSTLRHLLSYLRTYLLTYLITSFLSALSRVLLEKLTGFQLVKKFPQLYGTRRFITASTSARHLSLSWASSIQSIPPHPTSWRSILRTKSHFPSPLLSSYQSISPGRRLAIWVFRNMILFFYGGEFLAASSTPKLEYNPLSAVRDCLFSIFAATLHIGGRSSISNPRTHHAVVRGSHLSCT